MDDNKYQVVYVELASLKPHPKREFYKTPGPEFVSSIQDHGIRDPIKVQCGTNIIIGGHTRVESALEAGLTQVPVVYYDVDDDEMEELLILDNTERSGEETDLIKLARSIQYLVDKHGLNAVYERKAGRPEKSHRSRGDFLKREDIAAMFEMSPTNMDRHLNLLKLIPEMQKLTSDGKIGITVGNIFAALTPDQQVAYYERIKDEAKRPSFRIKERDALVYSETFKPKVAHEPEPGHHSDIFNEIGETVLDLSGVTLNGTSTNETPVVIKYVEPQASSIPSIFTDETSQIIKQVNDRYEIDGVPAVEVNTKKAAEVEKISSAFADPEHKVKYKKSIAKNEIDRAKATLARLESELPAVFSVDLFRDAEPELPSGLDELTKQLERFAQKVHALKNRFRRKESV